MTPLSAARILLIVLGAALPIGCSGNRPGPLACTQSIDQLCPETGACFDLSWTAVLANTLHCSVPTGLDQYYVADCGGYHVLEHLGENGSDYRYYDPASGTLRAVVEKISLNSGTETTCFAGPADGFTPPDCTGADFQNAPGWCAGDGGVDGSGTDGPAPDGL